MLAFRAAGHGLDRRRPRTALVAAAGAVGLRQTRHTDIALAARLEGVEASVVAGALVAEELVAVYGPRGAVWVVPAADQGVFTAGAAPVGEASPAGVMHGDDRAPASAGGAGVRLLPAIDPWLLWRDRKWLVPDPAARKMLWRATGSPGVVLAGGEPAGIWRTSTRGGRLTLRVEPFARAPDARALQAEAGIVGAVLGATGPVEVEVG